MSRDINYIGMDAHKESIVIAVDGNCPRNQSQQHSAIHPWHRYDQNSQNLGDRECLEKLRSRLQGILTRFYFCEFRGEKSFSTSHAI